MEMQAVLDRLEADARGRGFAARALDAFVGVGVGGAPDPPVRRPVCPLWSRLFAALPTPAWVTGGAIATALCAAFVGFDLVDGNLDTLFAGWIPAWAHVELRSAVVVAALVAGIAVTHHYEELGTRRDLARLAPRLRGAASLEALEREVGNAHPRWVRAAGALGALAMLALVPTLYVEPGRFLEPATYALPSVAFDLCVGLVVGWTVAKTLAAAVEQDRAFARLSQRVAEIDLLDLRPLAPFARRGQRRALRWLLLASIAAFVFIDAGLVAPPALALTGIIAFALFSFLLPVWGVHRRIRVEKQHALAHLRGEIRRERERLRLHLAEGTAVSASRTGGHLADLLAYEARIASAREWPVDGTTLLRFALYLLLPLGSWLGSAAAERCVEAALGR